jgi:hypothetical protein
MYCTYNIIFWILETLPILGDGKKLFEERVLKSYNVTHTNIIPFVMKGCFSINYIYLYHMVFTSHCYNFLSAKIVSKDKVAPVLN